MKRFFAAACVLFMIGTVPLGLLGGNGPEGGDLPDEEGSLTLAAGDDATDRFTYDARIVTEEDIRVLKDRCGLYDPATDSWPLVQGYGTGLVPPTEEEYATLRESATFYDGVTLAPSDSLPLDLDHSTEGYFPPVRSQGGMGSCASWATVYYTAAYAQAKDEGWTDCYLGTNTSRLLSPNWAYNKVNHGYDSGSSIYGNTMLLATLGGSDWKNMPYTATDPLDWGGEAAWRAAPRYRLQREYDYAYGVSTMVLKSWLVQGFVLPMALDANEYTGNLGTGDNVISSAEYSSSSINHANTIVGYDDTITADGDAGAFKIVNSWGASWGSAWGGNGYYYLTYDALAEISHPIYRIYDRVDYEPTLLATIDQSTVGSRDSRVVVGTDSGLYSNREPAWDAGNVNFPAFMAVDVTELEEDLGLTDFWLYIGSGDNASTVSDFELEWYENGYSPASPTRTFTSPDTPKTTPGYMDISFEDVHINVTAPLEGALVNKLVTLEGNATARIGRVILKEDFEGPWYRSWVNVDADSDSGYDTWGNSTYRVNNGNRSVWCAGSDHGIAYFEDFNHGGSTPSGWTTYSAGTDTYPWTMENSGYYGSGGSDYVAVADSDQGVGTNITEWLYMSTPFNASAFSDLELRFYLEYDYYDGEEWGQVLYATGTTYPTFTEIANYTSDTLGYKQYDISTLDGEEEVYLAFRYHGTDDWCMVVDDVLVAGNKTDHDHNMSANIYHKANCTGYDNVTLEYYYWLESENNKDGLYSMYWSSTDSKWLALKWHTGSGKKWTKVSVEVPTNATYVGFYFTSDGSTSYEGAYLDDVTLTGYIDLDAVDLSVDGGAWSEINTSAKWSYDWASGSVADGSHILQLRADYGGTYSYDSVTVTTENTAPSIASTWNDALTTGEVGSVYITVTDASGVGSVYLTYSFNGQTGVNVSVLDHTGSTWDYDLTIPTNAINLSYMFWVEDILGNSKWSSTTTVDVTDNDAPSLLADTTSSTATTGDPHTFAITATDNVAVDKIYVRYWYQGDATDTNVSSSGGTFSHAITVLHTLRPIYYELGVFDTSGLMDTTTGTVTISDNDVPNLGTDGSPGSATTGETAILSITATDNIGMSEMRAIYRFGTGTTQTVTMTLVGTDSWSYTVNIPVDSLDKLYYRFSGGDAAGNWNTSTDVAIDVLDNDLPTFGTDSTATTATTGDPFTFSIGVSDNIAVKGAWVLYRYGSGAQRNGTLSSSDGITWKLVVTIDDTLQDLTYSFGTEDTSGNLNTDPGGSVTISDNDAPTFGADATPATGTTGDPITFSIGIQDNIALNGAWLTYRYGSGTVVNVTLTSSDGLTWKHTLTVDDTLDDLTYTVGSMDTSGNVASTTGRTVDITDNDNPTFGSDATPVTATTGDPFTFSIEVDDNIEVEDVWVVYRYGSGTPVNLTLSTSDDLTWVTTINVEHTLDDLTYTFGSIDTSDNVASTAGGTVTITDNDYPTFGTDGTPSTPTTGDPFTFSIEVSDNIEIEVVWVYYQYGNGTSLPRTMMTFDRQVWEYTIDIEHTLSNLTYSFGTQDTSTNRISTEMFTLDILDNDVPTFGDDTSLTTADTDHLYFFSISVSDNIEVAEVWAEYRYGEGETTRLNLTHTTGSEWQGSMIVADTLDDLYFIFRCTDTSGNGNSTLERTVDVIDINGPGIINEGTKSWATTGDPHEFTITAHDNVGLKGAILWYAFGEGEMTSVEMEVVAAYPSSGNVLYSLVIDVPSDQVENITYSYEIADLYGNIFTTHVDIVRVRDDDDPSIVEDRTPGEANMGEDLIFVVVVSDNVGIGTVEVEYSLGDGDPVTAQMAPDGTGGVHTLTIEIAVDEPGPISYRFRVVDLAWNEVNGTQRQVLVVDGIPPEIIDVTWSDPIKGLDLEVVLDTTDNVGVEQASLSYRFGDGTETTVEMDENLEVVIPIPRNADGDLRLVFTVQDAAGNEVVSEEILVPLVNAAPTVDPVPLWEVNEDEDTYLDLAPFISDANDDLSSLTLSTGDGQVTVDGLVLRTLYVVPFPDRTIDLTVSDGEDETDFQITIHIVDVNDAPIIISVSPENGSKYKEGKVVTMSVIVKDQDGDDLTVTWTSDGVTIGTGETLEYKKLKPGTRTIKVIVSDGETSIEDEFTLTITKEEESPMLGGVFVLLAMLIGMAALLMRRKG